MQVIDHKAYVTPPDGIFQSRHRTVLHHLAHLAIQHSLPDLDVMFNTDDACPKLDTPARSPNNAVDRCHEMVRQSFSEHVEPYSSLSFST